LFLNFQGAAMAKVYKIHPAIGFARVGNSPEILLGPELPGKHAAADDGKYRDAAGRLRRQGARFWVYETDDANFAQAAQHIQAGAGQVSKIEWTVHLKNKKAAWFVFDGIKGEGPAGYAADHPLRNPTVANRDSLIIDPLARSISADGTARTHEISKGTSATPANENWPPAFSVGTPIESLGTLVVDTQGRLTVAGGYGKSGSPGALPPDGKLHYANNDNWFDDTSDGFVKATVHFADGTKAEAATAWLVVGPPDYAPPIENLVTVRDLLLDLALREMNFDPTIFASSFNNDFVPSFTKDVFPIWRRAIEYRWVIQQAAPHAISPKFNLGPWSAPPAAGETPATNPRLKIFQRMRDPDNLLAPGQKNMPRLHNDGIGNVPPEKLRFTVTRFQFHVLKQWSDGKFVPDWTGAPPATPTTVTPQGLDVAAMEAACGGSFFPGMEASWILRDQRVYSQPFDFRLNALTAESANGVSPGDVTKRMALPWQADFHDCASNWWPAQRPNEVLVDGQGLDWLDGIDSHVDLVDKWSLLGVVAKGAGDQFVETERLLPRS
jgi:hypothetical protein